MRPRPYPEEAKSYPLSEASTLRINDTLMFPVDFLKDAHIYAARGEPYEITRIQKANGVITFVIGTIFDREQIYGTYRPLLSKAFAASESLTIDLFDFQYKRRAGVLLAQTNPLFLFFPDGNFELEIGSVQFETACHVPMFSKALSGFRVNDALITGDVSFIGTQGVILECNDNTITVNFVGEPYYSAYEKARAGNRYLVSSVRRLTLKVECPGGAASGVTLVPDANGYISLYADRSLERAALRVSGRQGILEVGLAK